VGNGVGNSVDGGVVSRGGVDNGGSVHNGAGNAVSDNSVGESVSNDAVGEAVSGNNSVSKSVSDDTVGKSVTNDTVGNSSNNSSLSKVGSKARLGGVADGIGGSNGGNWGSEALGLAGAPHLTLERLRHGLVGPLTSGNNRVTNMAGQQLGGQRRQQRQGRCRRMPSCCFL